MPTLTEVVHAELGRVPVARRCCQRAEIATILRLAAALGRRDEPLMIEADLAEGGAARRLHALIRSAFGYPMLLAALPALPPGQPERHRVSVAGANAAELARRVGLLDGRGRPVRGLPPAVIGGPTCDAAAVWRAALLTSGRLAGPGHRTPLQVHPPDQVVALALVGAARRLEVTARSAETRGRWRVIVPDHTQVVALLERLGAAAGARAWQQSTAADAPSASGSDGANRQRAAGAGLSTARVRAALAALGEDAPAQLLHAGRLRVAHPQASLQQLGALTDPPISKDAVAGRIRRLLALADTHAGVTAPPPTHTAVPPADPLNPSAASWAATPAAAGCA